ncbi:response regulator [Spiractinospora alimapuensis]|uniref:response regulator n=1 Tax=Spiractinospora alimapuensis TaxID=2820884 RepID=UPI001F21C057|nr:response regulator [Spiractinospora alimapuensis]QVQ54562.1 response regulator [Spiractinospora alimapuensis]
MIRVLVVDDDFMVARIHRRIVERVPGFTVVAEARTGAEALELVRGHSPDLVLLDIYLPDITGIEVLRRLRELEERVDVLAVTAAKDAATVRKALHGGVVHYVIKPFEPEVLHDRLTHYRDTRTGLLTEGDHHQDALDRVFGTPSRPRAEPEPPPRTPKGLSHESVQLIETVLRREGDLSASECAQRTGLSRVSSRRYLEFLVEGGKAEVHLRYGTAGRPERRYRWNG